MLKPKYASIVTLSIWYQMEKIPQHLGSSVVIGSSVLTKVLHCKIFLAKKEVAQKSPLF